MKRIQNKEHPFCLFCHHKNYTKGKFDSFNCYQKYRYKTIPAVRKKVIERITIGRKKRYKKDAKFRQECMKHSRNWQKRNPEKVRKYARESSRRQYWRKKNDRDRN